MDTPVNLSLSFDPDCRLCPRLSEFLDQVKLDQPGYFARPVPAFGCVRPDLLIVGLAPGMHGANRTGRPFTGDYAGLLLYQTLHEFGFASAPNSESADDGLVLNGARITNAVKCLPPQNKPTGAEINCCNRYLQQELEQSSARVILALGKIAHDAVLKATKTRQKEAPFSHGGVHELPGERVLVDSYHCSRYNLNTRRLTESMFREVFEIAKNHIAQLQGRG